jgi:Protein of unknown function, DUF488
LVTPTSRWKASSLFFSANGIQSLADVRSAPYSRYVPHFNRSELEDALERPGIRYVYLGAELGGRPADDQYYDDHDHVLYYRMATAPFFLRCLERLTDEGALYRTAMMCSEEDPTNCHRHLLIARVLHLPANDDRQTEEDLKPEPTLWDAEQSPEEEEAKWKSIRPVSHGRLLSSSPSPSAELGSDDF